MKKLVSRFVFLSLAVLMPACSSFGTVGIVVDEEQGIVSVNTGAIESDITALGGNISNSYVVVKGVTLPFAGMDSEDAGYPVYEAGNYLLSFEGGDSAWLLEIYGSPNNYYEKSSSSKIPPYSGWVNTTNISDEIIVEFFPGNLASAESTLVKNNNGTATNLTASGTFSGDGSGLTGLAFVTNPVVQTVFDGADSNVVSGAGIIAGTMLKGVGYISQSGTITSYTNIHELYRAITNDSSAFVFPGTYNLTNAFVFTTKSNLSISSFGGKVTLNLALPNATNAAAVRFDNCTNLLVRGIDFRLDLSTTNWLGGGHAYCVYANADSGKFKDCTFINHSSLTTNEMPTNLHSVAFVQLCATNRALQVEDCTFIATTTQATNDAAHVQCVAVHNGHYLDRADFLRCNFVQSKNILYAQALNNTVDGTADLRDCNVMAYTPFTARCGLITQQDGKRLAPADLWQYIDGYKWCHSVGDTVRVFSESVGINGWYNIAQVLPNTFAGRSKMPLWNLRIDGYYQRTGTAGWVSEDISVINSGGTYTNSYYNRYDAVFLVTHDLTNTTIKMEASTGSTVKFAGELRFVPSMSVFTNLSYGVAEGYLVINEEAPLLP